MYLNFFLAVLFSGKPKILTTSRGREGDSQYVGVTLYRLYYQSLPLLALMTQSSLVELFLGVPSPPPATVTGQSHVVFLNPSQHRLREQVKSNMADKFV